MRKFVLAGFIATLGVAMLAIPASASFDRHFNVIEKAVSGEPVGEHAFRFKNKLVQPHNRDNRVGSDQGICRETPHRKLRCRVVVHLNGEIGGFGDIRVRGDLGRGDNRNNVVGGTGDFNGVGGKVLLLWPEPEQAPLRLGALTETRRERDARAAVVGRLSSRRSGRVSGAWRFCAAR